MAIPTQGSIRAEWKVSDVLARYPQLLQVLIDLSPAFGHLRNPLARTLRTRLVSVSQAARVAGMHPAELVRCLNQAVGIDVPDEDDRSTTEVQTEGPSVEVETVETTEELDVRPLLERGEEPFMIIMAAIARLPEHGALRLRTSFEPVPLYAVLARRGFSRSSRALAADDWEVIFSEPKTKRGRRTIPLGESAIAALQAQRKRTLKLKLRALEWEDLNLVFPNSFGRYLRADKVLVAFKRVLRGAGLPEKRLHDLRHTYATDLYAADVHPRSVQELLGHSRLDMTNDLYTGSVPAALRDAVERLDRARATHSR